MDFLNFHIEFILAVTKPDPILVLDGFARQKGWIFMDNNEQQKIVQFNRSIYMFCFGTKYKQAI